MALAILMCSATPAARAYAPAATAIVAERAVEVLPRTARATLVGPELSLALAAMADRAERDPEAFEVSRQVTVAPVSEGVSATDAAPAVDRAVLEYEAAREALVQAWRRADRMAAAEAMARLSQAAADLADPYRMSFTGLDEAEGARAWLADAFEPSGLATVAADSRAPGGPLELVGEAAAQRALIDAAVAAQDDAAVAALRAGLLSRASALVAATARSAWRPESRMAPAFRITPEPLQGAVTLFSELPAAGAARLELFDVAGRRVRSYELGMIPAGPHSVTVPAIWSAGLPSGIYLARLSAGDMRNECRVTRIAE